jgi:hypothetical protein
MELAACLVAAALHLEGPAFAEAGGAWLRRSTCSSAAAAGVDCWAGCAGHFSALESSLLVIPVFEAMVVFDVCAYA